MRLDNLSTPIEAGALAKPEILIETAADGSFICQSAVALQPFEPTMLFWLEYWAAETPAHSYLVERIDSEWVHWTYGQACEEANELAAHWLASGLVTGSHVAILASNSIGHARVVLACMFAGITAVPVNPRYATSPTGIAKLEGIALELKPQAFYVCGLADTAECAGIFEHVGARRLSPRGKLSGDGFPDASSTLPPIDGATVAKLIYTSGSTGKPKAVPYTQLMMSSNIQMLDQAWPFLRKKPLVMLDWLPWSHVFGGNNNLNLVLRLGGTLYVDAGDPTPAGLQTTLTNIEDVSPTYYCNVPAGYSTLVSALETRPLLNKKFFANLQAAFFAAAALPESLRARFQKLALQASGRSVPMLSGWGATESGPSATAIQQTVKSSVNVGTPLPGVQLRLVPCGNKLEAWIKSPSVTAGYSNNPEASKASFDEDGFFKSGDALRFANSEDPNEGLEFDGRIAEDFKLQSGTWVNAAAARAALLSLGGGWIRDVVLVGPNRPHLCVLVWLHEDGKETSDTGSRLAEILTSYNASAGGAGQRILNWSVLSGAPSVENGEINEKGYVNQSRARDMRAPDADALYH